MMRPVKAERGFCKLLPLFWENILLCMVKEMAPRRRLLHLWSFIVLAGQMNFKVVLQWRLPIGPSLSPANQVLESFGGSGYEAACRQYQAWKRIGSTNHIIISIIPICAASCCSYQSCYVVKVGWHHRHVVAQRQRQSHTWPQDNRKFQIHPTLMCYDTKRKQENQQTLNSPRPGIVPTTFPLRGGAANHCATASPRFASFRRDRDTTWFIQCLNKYFYTI